LKPCCAACQTLQNTKNKTYQRLKYSPFANSKSFLDLKMLGQNNYNTFQENVSKLRVSENMLKKRKSNLSSNTVVNR
jgi:hypothetical protein